MDNDLADSTKFTAKITAITAPNQIILDYAGGFGDTSILQANQTSGQTSSVFTSNLLRLTDGHTNEGTSVFTKNRCYVKTFATSFTFDLHSPQVGNADGITFCIQGNSPFALGDEGGGLGYGPNPDVGSGPSIPNSVAVKFDIFQNQADPGHSTTGLFTNGQSPAGGASLDAYPLNSLGNGVFQANLNYDGTTLTLSLQDNQGRVYTQSYVVDIPALVGGNSAYVGFTGATGSYAATQEILTWTYSTPPASVSGALLLDSLAPNAPAQNVTFTFRPTDGGANITQTLAVPVSGAFTLPGLPAKAYTLHIKGDKYLAANVPLDLSAGDVSSVMATLPAGDANDDNSCDATDFGFFVSAYNSSASVPGSGYDPTCDFNGDGNVDPTDFGLLVGSYNTAGAP